MRGGLFNREFVVIALWVMIAPATSRAGAPAIPKGFGSMGESDRVAALAPFFSPSPFEEVKLEPPPEQQKIIAGTDVPPDRLGGYIRVSPPKGSCFRIERLTQESDPAAMRPPVKVCKEQDVPFRLGEMDEYSELSWLVRADKHDQGTRISWRLPHRIAFVVPYNVKIPAEPTPVYIRGCEATRDEEMGRRVFVSLFNGERWFIRFPPKDYMVDSGPEVYLDTGDQPLSKDGFGYRETHRRSKLREEREARKAEAKAKAEAEKAKAEGRPVPTPKPDEGDGHGAKKAKAPKKGSKLVPTPTPKPKGPFQPTDFTWKISRFGTFTMNAANFMPDGAVTPGMVGECRYTYETSGPEFPEGGLIECHGADRYAYLYLPLNCMGNKAFRAEKVPPPKKEEPTPEPSPTPKPH